VTGPVPDDGAFVDANVVVPYLSGHDADLLARSQAIIEADATRTLSVIVVLEAAYVLKRVYGYRPKDVAAALHDLVARANVRVAEVSKEALLMALMLWRDGRVASAGDALIAAAMLDGGARAIWSFDRRLPKLDWEVRVP
jgi:predicted nucleic acid-binding protein